MNLMVSSCSGQVVCPQILRKFVGAVPELHKGWFWGSGYAIVHRMECGMAHDNVGWLEIMMGRFRDLVLRVKQGFSSSLCQYLSIFGDGTNVVEVDKSSGCCVVL